jgi:hypothetical protein
MILLLKAEASELDEKNAMALAIVPVGKAFFAEVHTKHVLAVSLMSDIADLLMNDAFG